MVKVQISALICARVVDRKFHSFLVDRQKFLFPKNGKRLLVNLLNHPDEGPLQKCVEEMFKIIKMILTALGIFQNQTKSGSSASYPPKGKKEEDSRQT